MQRYWFGDVDHGVCHPAGSDRTVLDHRLDHLAPDRESFVPLRWEDAVLCGIVQNREEYLYTLRLLCMQRAERKVRTSLEEKDQEIIQMVRLLTELDTTINGLLERVTDWFSLTTPDVIQGRGFRQEKVLIDRMKEHHDPALCACLEGVEVLRGVRSTLSRQITVRAEALFPNCSALVGGLVAARLVTRAGGLQELARMPSATIQVLGAEAALFSHLRTGTPPPKTASSSSTNGFTVPRNGSGDGWHGSLQVSSPSLPGSIQVVVRQYRHFSMEPRRELTGRERIVLRIDGVLVSPGKGGVYGERMIGDFRVWDPQRSKCAALAEQDPSIDFTSSQKVLYLGAAHGTTVSHIADYVEVIYAVEIAVRPMQNLLRVCRDRLNIIPIMADARNPSSYAPLVEAVDIIYQDVASPSQVRIALDHRVFLKEGGMYFLMLKTPCMDSRRSPEDLCCDAVSALQPTYRILNTVWLEPYHRDHAAIVAQATPPSLP